LSSLDYTLSTGKRAESLKFRAVRGRFGCQMGEINEAKEKRHWQHSCNQVSQEMPLNKIESLRRIFCFAQQLQTH